MDVSGWTVDQRMRLPDWCFGNRKVICSYIFSGVVDEATWSISELALPDPCCIWKLGIYWIPDDPGTGILRIALSDTVPISIAQMDACQEIFPHFGQPNPGPNRLTFRTPAASSVEVDTKVGLVTGGKKLVAELYCLTGGARALPTLWVSELPTSMAGWLAHNKV